MKEPLISIIVPVYNVEKYLEKCISSITMQTYKNLQVIIVDDGTKDNSGKLADALATADNRIEVYHKENGGLSSARNEGMKHIKGEYVMFIDSDDYMAHDMCEKLISHAVQSQCDLVECGFVNVYKTYEKEEYPCSSTTILTGREATKAYLTREHNIQSAVWVTLYHKSVLEGIKFEVGRLHEDGWFKYLVLYAAKRVALIPDCLYYYVKEREGSIMTANLKEKNVRDVLDSFVVRWHYFEHQGDEELAILAKNVYLNNLLSYHYSIYCKMEDKQAAKRLMKEFRSVLLDHKSYILSSPSMKDNRLKFWVYFYLPRISTFISKYRSL